MYAMKKNIVACAKREDSGQPVHLQSVLFWVCNIQARNPGNSK